MTVFPRPRLRRQREKQARAAERGQASVELVLILFIVLSLVFGAFSLGQGVAVKHALDVATEKAARLLSIAPDNFAAADLLIRREVDASVLGGGYGSQVGISLARPTPARPSPRAICRTRLWLSCDRGAVSG
jgi:hypothetical protein